MHIVICRNLVLCYPKTLEEKSFCSSKSSRALQAFGLLPLPCFTNSFLLAARVLRVNVNSLSARKMMRELDIFVNFCSETKMYLVPKVFHLNLVHP